MFAIGCEVHSCGMINALRTFSVPSHISATQAHKVFQQAIVHHSIMLSCFLHYTVLPCTTTDVRCCFKVNFCVNMWLSNPVGPNMKHRMMECAVNTCFLSPSR